MLLTSMNSDPVVTRLIKRLYFKYYSVLEWESTFTLGQNTAKSSNYIEKCFTQKLSKIKFSPKNSIDANLYLPHEWSSEALKISTLEIL